MQSVTPKIYGTEVCHQWRGEQGSIAGNSATVTNRHQMLQQLSTDILQLQRKTVELLLKNYTWPANK